MKRIAGIAALAAVGILSGCATAPTGPSVLALPGTGRSFEDFRASDAQCRAYAWQQIGGMTQPSDPGGRDAIVGTGSGLRRARQWAGIRGPALAPAPGCCLVPP